MFASLQRLLPSATLPAGDERTPLLPPQRDEGTAAKDDLEAGTGDSSSRASCTAARATTGNNRPSLLAPAARVGPKLPTLDELAAEGLKQAIALWPIEAEKIAAMPRTKTKDDCNFNFYDLKVSLKQARACNLLDRYTEHGLLPPAATREKLLEAIWSEVSVAVELCSCPGMSTARKLVSIAKAYQPAAEDSAQFMQEVFYPGLH